MDEHEFWKIIDDAAPERDPYENIRAALSGMNRDEILSFQNIFTKQLAAACTFPLLAANFVIESYVSDDGFREFRAWLVSQGRDRFRRAVLDPESIADWLDRSAVDEIDGEPMLCAAQEAYGDESKFLQKARFEPDPKIIQEWPMNKTEYRRKYPKLVDKYWNDERIREMHAD